MVDEVNLFMLLEKAINDKNNIMEYLKEYLSFIKCNNVNLSKVNPIERCLYSFSIIKEKDTGWFDFLSTLRQVILNFNRRIKINQEIVDRVKVVGERFDFQVQIEMNYTYLNVVKKKIDWLENKHDIERLYEFNGHNKEMYGAIGDYRLYKMTGFKGYSSHCQKLIVRAIENQIGGTTLLGTMPTGGGKSLPAQFVSYYEKSGTTIVVVPTIALAIDQSLSSERYFNKERVVRAYYDGVSQSDKYEIFDELQSGKISILYLSPESILNGSFNDQIIKATRKGIIKRLVIDEAHLILEWGEFFRTEFQFLSIFRKRLLKESKGGLKTVLLSATVTKETEKTLKLLYSEEDKFIQIRGDSLRNEITFYINRCQNGKEREKKVLELLPMLPRPIIIYVPVIEKANRYYELITEQGFIKVEKFTSETATVDRERIMRAWETNRIDIMVATSAFGMGVNKKEVRTIIHTFIPESIDRFYQEVGRGGRDGYNSLSFIFTSLSDDEDHIQFFTGSKVLSVEKIIERWKGILENYIEMKSTDELWIDSNTVPQSLRANEQTGSLNVAWNEYVVLFLYRQGIIDILDVKLDLKTRRRVILIKLKRLDLINNMEALENFLIPIRERERFKVDKEIHYVKDMITKDNLCWGRHFTKVYRLTEEKCNGCPRCRKKGIKPYISKNYTEVYENDDKLKESFILNRYSSVSGIIIRANEYMGDFKKLIDICIDKKIDCLVLDDNISWEKLEYEKLLESKIYFYTYNDLLKHNDINYIYGNVAIIFSEDDEINDKLYKYQKKLLNRGRIKTITLIAYKDLEIISENKTLSNLIEGTIKYIGGM